MASYTSHTHAYIQPAHPLQSLTIHQPQTPTPTQQPGHGRNQILILYLHGGAWRDPTQDSSTIAPSLSHLFPPSPQIAALISINYRLSPYPTHPTQPSQPTDPHRTVRHPAHLTDVVAALGWVAEHAEEACGIGIRIDSGDTGIVLVGHSCGATMWLQLLSSSASSSSSSSSLDSPDAGIRWPDNLPPPLAVVGLAGLYDLAALPYVEILRAAFGPDDEDDEEKERSVWAAASPARRVYGWRGLVVLAWSEADGLVEGAQRERMVEALRAQGWKDDEACEWTLTGSHDEVWQNGRELAEVVGWTVQRVMAKKQKEGANEEK